jgi:deoxyadenosine/deoxycytidine kinase
MNPTIGFTKFPSKVGRIEICGGIASGKTTLAQLLAMIGSLPVLENFQANPFWTAFYKDPAGTAFETEISFLLQHYHHIKEGKKSGQLFACDFSPYLDLAYAFVTLPDNKRHAFQAVYAEVTQEILAPNLLVHLRCDPEIELERIRRRGREAEGLIPLKYLQDVNNKLEEILRQRIYEGEQLEIDSSSLDFANDEEVKQFVLSEISQKISIGPQA